MGATSAGPDWYEAYRRGKKREHGDGRFWYDRKISGKRQVARVAPCAPRRSVQRCEVIAVVVPNSLAAASHHSGWHLIRRHFLKFHVAARGSIAGRSRQGHTDDVRLAGV